MREGLFHVLPEVSLNPFSVEKMQVMERVGAIIYRSGHNPKIQRNFEVFTPCGFIAAITRHLPDKSFQLVRCYGWYSNKMRSQQDKQALGAAKAAGNAIQIIDVSEHKPRRRARRLACRLPTKRRRLLEDASLPRALQSAWRNNLCFKA